MRELIQKLRSRQPQNPAQAKLAALANQLGQFDPTQGSVGHQPAQQGAETIADDAPTSTDKQAVIEADEALLRPALALFDIDYDALIRLEPTGTAEDNAVSYSPYARAVQANPALLQQVMQAERPVLAALKVALAFQPYAAFADKYGADPQSIRDALREELRQEILGQDGAEPSLPAPGEATPFSSVSYQTRQQKNKKTQAAAYRRPPLQNIIRST